MSNIYNKITTILKLLKNLIFRKKHYILKFVKEGNYWFYVFKNWGFNHEYLTMINGADELCELYSKGDKEVTVEIIASKKKENHPGYTEWEGDDLSFLSLSDRISWGRTYKSKNGSFWICPVTLFVLGRYPNFLYIKN